MNRPKPRVVWFADEHRPTIAIGRLDGTGHPTVFPLATLIRALAKRGAPA